MVNGSFGEGFAPQIDQSSISVYLTDICRTVTLDYVGNVTNYGVPSYRFAGTKRLFANATDNPDNWCFCSGNPSGVANFSTCRFDMPSIFVSFPHYYLADPYYADQVQGLNPQKELHEFYIDLEPVKWFSIYIELLNYNDITDLFIYVGIGRANISSCSSPTKRSCRAEYWRWVNNDLWF